MRGSGEAKGDRKKRRIKEEVGISERQGGEADGR